jgi:hypothetical protein
MWAMINAKTKGSEFYNNMSKGIAFRISQNSSPDIGLARPKGVSGGKSFNAKMKGRK